MVKSIALRTDVTLQYADQGRRLGIPVVFLHGVTDSWRAFEPVLARLPAAVRALAITQRGHGDSGKPEHGYRYNDLSEDLHAFMDALDLPQAVIVGHSMGSLVAQRFAIDCPERVAGLVLMGAFRTVRGSREVQQFWDSELSALEDPVPEALVRNFQVSTLARDVPPEFLDAVVHESLKVPARVWRALFRTFLETPDFSDGLSRVTAPALIAWGDRDAYASRADQDALRAALPAARCIVYAGGGHAFHWEEPGRFAGDLMAFVYERRGRGAATGDSHDARQPAVPAH
jgi:pimeloyl-ACP methyl ester carboxylesterase